MFGSAKRILLVVICVFIAADSLSFAAIPTTLPTQEVRAQVCLNGIWNFLPDGYGATTIRVPSTWDKYEGQAVGQDRKPYNSLP